MVAAKKDFWFCHISQIHSNKTNAVVCRCGFCVVVATLFHSICTNRSQKLSLVWYCLTANNDKAHLKIDWMWINCRLWEDTHSLTYTYAQISRKTKNTPLIFTVIGTIFVTLLLYAVQIGLMSESNEFEFYSTGKCIYEKIAENSKIKNKKQQRNCLKCNITAVIAKQMTKWCRMYNNHRHQPDVYVINSVCK